MIQRIPFHASLRLLFFVVILSRPELFAQGQSTWTTETAAKWFKNKEWFKDATPGFSVDPSVDQLEFAIQYHAHQQWWDKAFSYLMHTDLAALKPGRFQIDGINVTAIVTEGPPKLADTTQWEAHRNYADIHCVIYGKEKIEVTPVSSAKMVINYDSAHDIAYYQAKGKSYIATPHTFFIITTPYAHRPFLKAEGYDMIKKIVVKVRKT